MRFHRTGKRSDVFDRRKNGGLEAAYLKLIVQENRGTARCSQTEQRKQRITANNHSKIPCGCTALQDAIL